MILEISELTKDFGGVRAMDRVSFAMRSGESLGIIGPNGSGKTTLVNLITGFVQPDRGAVLYQGKRITRMRPHRIAQLGIGRSFQMARPFYHLPAFKNLVIPLCSRRVKKLAGGKYGDRDAIAIDLLEEVGFERDSFVPFKTASSLPHGYLKRLELARCLALRPDLVILDELFSGLSLAEVSSVVPIIEKLQTGGKTLIMIEHRLRELFRIVDRVIVLRSHDRRRHPERSHGERSGQAGISGHGVRSQMLQIRDMMVFFENGLAINDLSMEVNEGDFRGVIGSNSAGKTTLMNSVSGLILDMKLKEQRQGGERITILGAITYQGRDITDWKPSDRVRSGIVLCRERHPIFPESSVLENLKIAGFLKRRTETRKSVDHVFELFPNLRNLRRRKAGFLSGGEQQMLSIGMALVAQPKLLLLDEPLLGLSPAIQKHLVETIVRIRDQRGTTILIAEQFARPILPLLDYAYVIESGILTLSGKGPELMENPEVRAAYFGV
jgi:branched-chain amino acid transport system ATP-binding protein